ncbi:DUF1254 domain-containing protein [Rhizobium sp. TRM95111]|uniref:DUF1254 domain-containing protein n=1 Tax=Rhizobium alarense TaxID=2846851 RepID=UPI001F2D373F|nr:DUF1254 domain-containing protein [Rhizobium alarense]MCF3642616.1 DUF1254 domain-containing protein [Rhizobium alarense]
MRSLLYALAVGLAGAAILHVLTILVLPQFTGRDAYTRVQAFGELHRFFPVTSTDPATDLPTNDNPALRTAVCAFSLEENALRLIAEGEVTFWSLAVFDAGSNEVFSMNDRTSVGGVLDVVVATPVQLNAIRKAQPDDLSQSILVEMAGSSDGYVVLRTLVPAASTEDAARAFLSSAACEPRETSTD